MTRRTLALLAAALAAALLGTAPPATSRLSATTVAGMPLKIEPSMRQVVVLQFWATWCAPCLEEMPHIEAARRRLNGLPVRIVGVAIDQGASRGKVAAGGRAVGYSLVRLQDSDIRPGNVPDRIPETLVYDRRGHLRYIFRGGEAPLTANRLEQVVRKLLAER